MLKVKNGHLNDESLKQLDEEGRRDRVSNLLTILGHKSNYIILYHFNQFVLGCDL